MVFGLNLTLPTLLLFFSLLFPGLDINGNGNGNGLLFHMTQPISRSTIKAIACSKPTISEH